MKTYLVGHPGTGKSTRLTVRLASLIGSGTRPDRILVLVPQHAQADRFRAVLARVKGNTRGEPYIGTVYGLAQQHVGLFFPRIAPRAGFADPLREPVFINVESAQYFLGQIVAPRLTEFDDLKMQRSRLISQILDSMNKAATSGFGLDELADRLTSAWHGTEPRAYAYQRVQQIALAYRDFCLQHSLLDFSLLVELFGRQLLQAAFYREFVTARYRHVLADNIEEGTPVLHDLLALLLQTCDSAILAEDDPGGYRLFLGADRQSARTLRESCDEVVVADDPRLGPDAPPSPAQFGAALMRAIETNDRLRALGFRSHGADAVEVLDGGRYWAGMVQAVVERIVALTQAGVPAQEMAVLAPFVEDVLRFELEERLRPHGIGVQPIRPSRPLYDHPVSRMLTVWARLAHPHWQAPVSATELARALAVSIEELDVVRAQMIADAAHKIATQHLPPLEDQALWNRVGMRYRERYVALQQWLASQSEVMSGVGGGGSDSTLNPPPSPLDLFWQQLFTDVLSQPGFGLSADLDGATVCDRLVRSARDFRTVFEQARLTPQSVPTVEVAVLGLSPQPRRSASLDVGQAYADMLTQGLLAAQFVPAPSPPAPLPEGEGSRVLLAPIYAYLTGDHRSRVQFWLDITSNGWHERIYQPLTHPYVLSRQWRRGQQWTDENELYANRDMLVRLTGGLAFRCDEKIVLASSQLNVAGSEESGVLARAVQRVLVGVNT
jgi:hypothetical protein